MNIKTKYLIFTFFIFQFVLLGTHACAQQKESSKRAVKNIPNTSSERNKISFMENKGQVSDQNYHPRPDVLFSGSDGVMNYHLRNNGISYQLYKATTATDKKESEYQWLKDVVDKTQQQDSTIIYRLDITWLNANKKAAIEKSKVLPGYDNFYLEVCPNGVTGVKKYKQVKYKNLYQGIDLVYYENNGKLEYDFQVQPEADYQQIQLKVDGAESIVKNSDGSISIKTPLGTINEGTPIVYQNEKKLNANWIVQNNVLSFEVENYNLHLPLIIDPITRVWGTYYGNSGATEDFNASVLDASENSYAVGFTNSNVAIGIIATSGTHQTAYGGNSQDGMVVKFNSDGVRQWATYYGGGGFDAFYGCSMDASTSNLFVVGTTQATVAIATAGAHQTVRASTSSDGMVVKFDNNGIRQWGTYYGGTGSENFYGCTTDASDNIYCVGQARSTSAIATSGAHLTNYASPGGGFSDAMLVKFNSSGVRQWGTYYGAGGAKEDDFYSCITDASNNVYAVGRTLSTTGIATSGAHQTVFATAFVSDAMLVKFNSSGVRQWGTYYGSSGEDVFYSSAIDASNNIYIAGYTTSTISIASSGAYQTSFGGGTMDGMLMKFNSAGVRQWGTYYGGATANYLTSCVLDASNHIYVVGNTFVDATMITSGAYQTASGGNQEAILAEFDNNGVRQMGTYYGGAGADNFWSCRVGTSSGAIYAAGATASNTAIASAGSHQSAISTANDAMLVKFSTCPTVSVTVTSQTNITCNGASTGAATISVTGGVTYSYTWSPSGGTTLTATGLSARIYSVTTTSQCGSSATTTVVITQPTLAISIGFSTTTSVTCNGLSNGASTATASGGTGTLTYSWMSSGTTLASITGLSVGNYTVLLTDGNGCTNSKTVNIIQPALLISSISSSSVNCNGGITGSATATANGGTTNYTYAWSNGKTSNTNTGLISGIYTVIVTDKNTCSATSTVSIEQPIVLTATIVSTQNVLCAAQSTGFAIAKGSGGVGVYAYTWNNGTTIATNTGLVAGTYTAIITDVNGCTASVTTTITQPTAIDLLTGSTASTCGNANGEAAVSAIGGTGAYTYSWSDNQTSSTATSLLANTYTITVRDANNCSTTTTVNVSDASSGTITIVNSTNITCNGFNDGAATGTIVGGTSPYTYLWSNTKTTNIVTGLSEGIYTLIVTDNSGCSGTATVAIAEPDLLQLTTSPQNALCTGGSSGGASATANGGTGTYVYNWSNGVTQSAVTGLTTGIYTVLVTDSNGCFTTATLDVNSNPAISVDIVSTTSVSCNGGNNGMASVTALGGTPLFTYSWSNGTSEQTASNLTAGIYSIKITDTNGCNDTQTLSITEPTIVIANGISTASVNCNGASTGIAMATATGGTGVYFYTWNTGETTNTETGLMAGVYTITVNDSNGCEDITTVEIIDPDGLSLAIVTTGTINCNGGTDGEATATASGGTGAYTYSWSNGQSTQISTGLTSGLHTLILTDNNGCSTTSTINVTQPSSITFSSNSIDASCGNADGIAEITAIGGTGTYTYLWNNSQTTASISSLLANNYTVVVHDSNGCSNSSIVAVNTVLAPTVTVVASNSVTCNGENNGMIVLTAGGGTGTITYTWLAGGQTTNSLSNLIAGVYTIKVKDDNGCTNMIQVNIQEPNVLLTSSITTSVTCNGGNNGAVFITASGGSETYAYLWNNNQTDNTIIGLSAGAYTYTVTDANGCENTNTVIIDEPSLLQLTINPQNILCAGSAGGAATVIVNGGTGSYTYSWSNGETVGNVTGLTSGSYTLVATDANGCTSAATLTVNSNPAIAIHIVSTGSINCNGNNTGEAAVSASGGTPLFTYSWSNNQTTTLATGLTAGIYSIKVTDTNGCNDTQTLTITEPLAMNVSITSNDATCNQNNGTITTTVIGGTPSYTYSWSNNETTSAISNLIATTYTLLVQDDNGCSTISTATITNTSGGTVNVLNVTDVKCNGGNDGNSTTTMIGGTSPYSYSWTNNETTNTISNLIAGIYTVVITDATGCSDTQTISIAQPAAIAIAETIINATCNQNNGSITTTITGGTGSYTYSWSNSQTISIATDLVAGNQVLLITDSNGCTKTATTIITTTNSGTITIVHNATIQCNGDNTAMLTASIVGGVGPYTYNWSNGNTNQAISNVIAGIYTLSITDNVGCITTETVAVTEPSLLQINSIPSSILCLGSSAGGSASVSASGGTPLYKYTWSNNETTASVTNLSVGNYTITVIDANGCMKTTTLSVNNYPAILVDIVSTQSVACNGNNSGSITATAIGGTPLFTYSWSNGQTTNVNAGLTAGNYAITIYDSNGCNDTKTVTITEPLPISFSSAGITATCNQSNGSASTTITGGISSYSYSWSNNETDANITGLSSGIYTVVATDANACTQTNTVIIGNTAGGSIVIVNTTDTKCDGTADGKAAVIMIGGISPYTYSWNNNETNNAISNLTAGNYTVIATDATGCTDTEIIAIAEPLPISITTDPVNVLCVGAASGGAFVTASGGTPSYTYVWSNNETTTNVTNLTTGNYSVIVTDVNGCSATAILSVNSNPAISISSFNATSVTCSGGKAIASVSILGGTPTFTYSWSDGQTTQTATDLLAGSYSVQIMDSNGCNDLMLFTIIEPSALQLTTNPKNVVCSLGNNAGATAIASGGIPDYTYQWSNNETTANITNLSTGNYTVTLTDQNGCINTATLGVNNYPPVFANIITTTSLICNGYNTGLAIVSATGGTPLFSYSWSDGQSNQIATGLLAGNYSVTINDTNGCNDTKTITIVEPNPINIQIAFNDATCNQMNGDISVTATGGTPSYNYSWSNNKTNSNITGLLAGIYGFVVTDAKGCAKTSAVVISSTESGTVSIVISDSIKCNGDEYGIVSASINGGTSPYAYKWSTGNTSQILTNLIAGSYTVLITDNNGCTSTETVQLTEPALIILTTAALNDTCYQLKGVASVSVSGGTMPYNYNWSNNEITNSVSNLFSGTYEVQVIDASGCIQSATVTIGNEITATADAGLDTTIYLGAQAQLNGTGGTYTTTSYTWFPSTGLNNSKISNPIAKPKETTTYTLIVNDNNGCTATDEVTITVEIDCSNPDVFIPNSFSPNEDGINDVLFVRSNCIQTMTFTVYNRWGEKVFESNVQSNGWDGTYNGTLLGTGVYAYFIEADLINGKIYNDKGTIMIVK